MTRSDEHITIETPENVEFEYEVVGIGTRFVAAIADHLILGLILFILNLAAALLASNFLFSALQEWAWAFFALLSFLIVWGYFIFFEWRWHGQSPGKRWAQIRVVRRDGTPISVNEALIRNLVRVIDFLPISYGLGIVTMFIHPRACRLGDLAAGTMVVRDTGATFTGFEQPIGLRTMFSDYEAQRVADWPLERLNSGERELIRNFLQRYRNLPNGNELALAIVTRLLTRFELPEEPVRASEAPAILAALMARIDGRR